MDFDSLIESCYSIWIEDNARGFQSEKETLSFFRTQLEPYVFNYLNHTWGAKLDDFWKNHTFPKKAKYGFVIVERRPHPNWWFILRNIAWAGPNMSLDIFCSDLNYDFIKTLLGSKADNVNIHIWFKGYADKATGYKQANITSKMPQFYSSIDTDYFIKVEMDSYFIQKIPEWIFTGTYYGAPWIWNLEACGNGGLSVRNNKNLIELCQREINTSLTDDGEDHYISTAIIKHGYNYPPLEFRKKVFQESFPTETNPIGTHQFWTFITNYNIGNKDMFSKHIKKLVTLDGL